MHVNLYELQEFSGKVVCVSTAGEIAEFLGLKINTIYGAAKYGLPIRKKYTVKVVDELVDKQDSLWDDFDMITNDVLRLLERVRRR